MVRTRGTKQTGIIIYVCVLLGRVSERRKRRGEYGRDIELWATHGCSLHVRRYLPRADVKKCGNQARRASEGTPRKQGRNAQCDRDGKIEDKSNRLAWPQ